MAFATALLSGCMGGENIGFDDEWDAPNGEYVAGNEKLTETNLMTIAQLKEKYASTISSSGLYQFTEPTQIKGVVTSNDIESNIYNQVSIDDGTASMVICIAQGGLFATLPIGQEILVELKDLYIGAYSMQPEIGVPYTNKNGKTYVSRMSRYLWNEHYKAIGKADASKVKPEVFDQTKLRDATYMKENCGKLMTIQNVEFTNGGTTTYAPDAEKDAANCVNRSLKGISSSNLVIRTSSYADFAASTLPTGKVNITGIFTRYSNLWQVLIVKESDVEIINQ